MTIRSRIITTFVVIFTMTIISLVSQKIMISKGEALNYGLDHINLELMALLALENTVNREKRESIGSIEELNQETYPIEIMPESLNQAFEDVWAINSNYHVPDLFAGFEDSELEEKNLERILKNTQNLLLKAQKQVKLFYANNDAASAFKLKKDIYAKELGPDFILLVDKWIQQEKNELRESREAYDKYMLFHVSMMNSIGFGFLLILLWLSYSLNKTIGRRLEKLVNHTRRLAKGDFQKKVDLEGNDELTRLAVSFNEMTDELSKTQDKLLEQSYQSGMSGVAADILHNVKNSFSGISSGCEKINSIVRGSRVVKIRKAVRELQNNKGAATEKEQASLLEYIELASHELEEQLEKIREANSQIENTFFLIDSILTDQYRYTKVNHPFKWHSLYRMLIDTIPLLEEKCKDVVTITIDPAIKDLGQLRTHRIVFIQIVTNLLINAIESVVRHNKGDGLVEIKGFVQKDGDDELIHLTITDNGVGIGPDNFETLFQRGRTSKSDMTHSGLGLHWVANIIQTLDGRIYAESEGIGKGATFHLIIRRNAEQNVVLS